MVGALLGPAATRGAPETYENPCLARLLRDARASSSSSATSASSANGGEHDDALDAFAECAWLALCPPDDTGDSRAIAVDVDEFLCWLEGWFLATVGAAAQSLRGVFVEYGLDPAAPGLADGAAAISSEEGQQQASDDAAAAATAPRGGLGKLIEHCCRGPDGDPLDGAAAERLRADASRLCGTTVELDDAPLDACAAFTVACHRRGVFYGTR